MEIFYSVQLIITLILHKDVPNVTVKNKTIELSLPILDRKWKDVPLTYSSRYEESSIKKNSILEDLTNGMKNKDICHKYGVIAPYVSNLKKKYLLNNKCGLESKV